MTKPKFIMRGSWAIRNAHFRRCRSCGGLQVLGVCQRCGFAALCAWCKSAVRQADGSFRRQRVLDSYSTIHTICPDCRARLVNILGGEI